MPAHILKPAAHNQDSTTRFEALAAGAVAEAVRRTCSWRGASGRRYAHTVYALIECPPLPDVAYVLVRRVHGEAPELLSVDACDTGHATLNLARVRHAGARLGATEVHVHLLASTPAQRMLATCDLRAGLLGTLSAEWQPTNA